MSVTNQDIEYMQYLIGAKNKLVCGADTAIKALRPNAKYDLSVQGGVYEWLSWEDPTGTNPPTKEEIFTELEYQNKFIDYHQYFLDRLANYPDIVILVCMLWDAIDQGKILGKDTEFYTSMKEVNDRFPKTPGDPPVRPTY